MPPKPNGPISTRFGRWVEAMSSRPEVPMGIGTAVGSPGWIESTGWTAPEHTHRPVNGLVQS